MFNRILKLFVLGLLAAGLATNPAMAAKKKRLKPYVLASESSGDLATKVDEVKRALTGNGFDVVGEYAPYADTHVLVITNDNIKKKAAANKGGAYAAAQRVSIVKNKGKVQVAFFNPTYMAHAYRMKDELEDVYKQLSSVLGNKKEFGSKKGLKKRKLRKYHYTFGMEYFDEPYELGSYSSHAAAVKAVERGLAANKGGVTKVSRIDMPGQTLFSVGLKSTTNKHVNDKNIMGIIDFGKYKHAAHMPYDLLVNGKNVYALHARFRIATSFPDLSMMGEQSFMKIMKSPEAIHKALKMVAGE